MTNQHLDGSNWHFRADQPVSFGCNACFLKTTCGGLRVRGAAFDCQRFCCGESNCETVCFNSPVEYAKRLKEVGGFELDTIPRCDPVKFDHIQGYAPLFHHAYSRKAEFFGEAIAISLFELLDRGGAPKYFSKAEISQNFRIDQQASLIVSGIQKDFLLERVWRSPHRTSIALMLKSIGVALFTSPNFSVYNNVPRPENLYNIKRIGLISYEFLAAGVPTALHINACTDTDYDNYARFLSTHTEFEAISFDFITGPGYPSRLWWHTGKLIDLRNRIGRPVQLVLRGGTRALSALSGAYSNIVIVDSDPLHKALHRQRMIFGNDGHISVVKNPLPAGMPVDDLVKQNVAAAKLEVDYLLKHPRIANSIRRLGARNAYDKSLQRDFLTNPRGSKARTNPINRQSMIAASKPERTAEVKESSKQISKTTAVPGAATEP
jgi:hypothetical protein